MCTVCTRHQENKSLPTSMKSQLIGQSKMFSNVCQAENLKFLKKTWQIFIFNCFFRKCLLIRCPEKSPFIKTFLKELLIKYTRTIPHLAVSSKKPVCCESIIRFKMPKSAVIYNIINLEINQNQSTKDEV